MLCDVSVLNALKWEWKRRDEAHDEEGGSGAGSSRAIMPPPARNVAMLTEIDGTNGSGDVSRYLLLQGGSAPFREIWSELHATAVDHNTEARIFGHGATGGG